MCTEPSRLCGPYVDLPKPHRDATCLGLTEVSLRRQRDNPVYGTS